MSVTLSSDLTVKLIRSMASDDMVIQAAQVSVKGENDPETVPIRLIHSLMKHRHGVPFEHTSFTFYVEVPIFVARQWVKHRMSSMNEFSARYGKVLPRFYAAGRDRPMVNKGTKMDPDMVIAPVLTFDALASTDLASAETAWKAYEQRLDYGVAEELARTVLPLSTYTQFYWTLNARSLMNFLERRVSSEESRVSTHPQWEIEMAAKKIEFFFADAMPATHEAFVRFGRVAP